MIFQCGIVVVFALDTKKKRNFFYFELKKNRYQFGRYTKYSAGRYIYLRHLYIEDDAELPPEMGKLTCPQTLEHFAVGDYMGYGIEELGSLKNLKGRLHIHNLEKVRDEEEAERAMLFEKPNITELHLKWDEGSEGLLTNDESVLKGLQPHPNLKKIGIYGFKCKRFASWQYEMGSWVGLDKLMEVTLWECNQCEEIPMLGHLPNLKSLYLTGLKKVCFIIPPFHKLTEQHSPSQRLC